MKNKVVFLVLILCLVFSGNVYAGSIKSAKLEKCVDGDTAYFIVDGESYKYRFLAINTPEKKETYGDIASEVTCNMLTNAKKIEIEIDDKASKTDKYGRSLGWIFVDDQLYKVILWKMVMLKLHIFMVNINTLMNFANLKVKLLIKN